MSALLKLVSWNSIINYVVAAFLGVLPSMWKKTQELVAQAETRFPSAGSGEDKKAWVMSELKNAYGGFKQHILDTLVGLALEAMRKKIAA